MIYNGTTNNLLVDKEAYANTHKGSIGIFAITPVHKKAIELIGGLQTKKLLDIGCGNGEVLYLAHQEGALVSGVDFDKASLSAAQAKIPEAQLIEGSLPEVTFSENKYDAVVMLGILGYLNKNDVQTVLVKVAQATNPGARVVIRVSTKMNILGNFILKLFNKDFVTQDFCHSGSFYQTTITRTGFTITKTRRAIDAHPSSFLKNLIKKIATPLLGSTWYVAEKR